MSGSALSGCHFMVVEDEFIVGAMLVDVLEDEGAIVTGPIGRLDEALELAQTIDIHAAVLDWNLQGEPGAPIARVLIERGVPFVIATGYGSIEDEFVGVPVMSKPYSPGVLIQELARLVG